MDRTCLEIVGTRLRIISLASLLSVVCLTIPYSLGSQLPETTIRAAGTIRYSSLTWLHVDGKYIKNEDNQTVFLRGAAFSGLDDLSYWQGGYDFLVYRMNQYMLLSNGKANVIRCPITPFPQDTTDPSKRWPSEPSAWDDDVDQLVSLAKQNNIYVVIEFHGGLSQSEGTRVAQDPTDFINWWLHWVNRYIDNPVVCGFELYNEPFAPNFGGGNIQLGIENYRNLMRQVCEAISAVNPKVLLLVSSSTPRFNFVDSYYFTNPLPYNVVYTWDYYYKDWSDDVKNLYRVGDWEAAKQATESAMYGMFGRAMQEYNLPCLASEFGWYMDDNREPGWQVQQQHYHGYMNKMETNWYQWCWGANPGNLGLAQDMFNSLSPTGEVWKIYLD